MEGDFSILVDLLQTFGTWMIFLYLFLKERESHERTRAQHLEDLRDVAGFSGRLRPPKADPE
jgi:hypothetical protein